MAFNDNFNRADSSIAGNNWTESVDARWSILNNKLRATGGGNENTNQIWRPASENFANGNIEVEFTRSAMDAAPQVHARKQAGAVTYYQLFVFSDWLLLSKVINNGARVDLFVKTGLTALAAVGNTFKLTLTLNGSTLTGRVEGVTNPGLIWEQSATDSSITGAGQCGLSIGSAGTVNYDNFCSFQLIDATKSVTDNGTGADSISATDTSNTKNPIDGGTAAEGIGVLAAARRRTQARGRILSPSRYLSICATVALGQIHR